MKKKILFILNSLTAGGAEKQTISLVNKLDKDGFAVSLVYLDPVDTLLPQVESEKLTVLECLHRKKRLDRSVIQQLSRLIQRHQFHTVVCVGPYPLVYAFLCRWFGRHDFRVLEIFHLTIPRPGIWTAIKNRLLFKYLMNRCEKIVFVCQSQMAFWIDHFSIRKDKAVYIYNGVDITRFSDDYSEAQKQRHKEEFGFTENDFIVGMCATLRAEKKHTDFIDAVKLAKERIPDIKGLIIGGGILEKEIKHYIEINNMSATIKMTGFQHDIRPFVSICHCLVLTSHSVETFSLSALESMAMAKPVIMTDLGGARELIEHGVSGFVYEKGDIEKLVKYLSLLAQNGYHFEMGAKARTRVRRFFTDEIMIEEYRRLLLTI